jgi:alkyl hydroperoxide reductase subunit AhpC
VKTLLQSGDIAPDFRIPVLIGGVRKEFRLADHRGKRNLVLAFHPANWDPVSARQMVNYQVEREKFQARQTEVLGISVDSIMNATSWEREIGPFDFWLGSDFWPHGEVSRRYGILQEAEPCKGACERAVFVIDKSGKIHFARIYPSHHLPDLEETLDALRELAKT